MTLMDCLVRLGTIWAKAHDKELSTLGTIVAKDGKFFGRIEAGKGCNIATWEKFIGFFREAGNWPECMIPADAAEVLDEIQMIATGPEPFVGREVQLEAFLVHDSATSGGDAGASPDISRESITPETVAA